MSRTGRTQAFRVAMLATAFLATLTDVVSHGRDLPG